MTLDTISNCLRPVFSLAVSQHVHKLTKLFRVLPKLCCYNSSLDQGATASRDLQNPSPITEFRQRTPIHKTVHNLVRVQRM